MGEPKERPILFSGPMVGAILEGRKTVTRRVVNFLPEYQDARYVRIKRDKRISKYDAVLSIAHEDAFAACPYGLAGDRLWVRETWYCAGADESDGYPVRYRADASIVQDVSINWRPSIFMFRWMSRITLEIISVRVERLQEITADDVVQEGVGQSFWPESNLFANWQRGWDALNAKRGFSWDSNPWVWRIEFKKVA
jgi:hypothetical protein